MGGQPAGDGFAGITGDLVDGRFSEKEAKPIANQNSKLLRVRLGEPFMARQGAMVAYQGNVDFAFEGGGASKFIKKALTGEGLPLMRCQGQGDVFLAERAYDVHLLNLNNSGLSISGKNVLAFSVEPRLEHRARQGRQHRNGRAVQYDVARHGLGGADHRRPTGGPQRGRGTDLRRHQRSGGVVGEPADPTEDELQGRCADRPRLR